MNLRIDIISDVVCPWCVIGYKRLEKALEAFGDQLSVDLHWHPFELNPDMPHGGENLRAHLAQKYGTTLEGSIAARKKLTALGADLGFAFDYFDEMRMFNTFKAHQLLLWAREAGKQTELKMRLFEIFFGERGVIDEVETLIQAAADVGLDPDQAKAVLSEERYAEGVRAEQAHWRHAGIYAVPTIIFNQQQAIQGAREIDGLTRQLATMTGLKPTTVTV